MCLFFFIFKHFVGFLVILLFFNGRVSKLSLKLKKRSCQEYGDFRIFLFFFQNLKKPFPIHILWEFFSHERKLPLVSRDIFFKNPIGRASKLSLKLKKQNCQYGDFRKKVFVQNSIKTFSHTYFGRIFFSHERKLPLVSRDFLNFFQILL